MVGEEGEGGECCAYVAATQAISCGVFTFTCLFLVFKMKDVL